MLKKLLISFVILASSLSTAMASNYKDEVQAPPYANYKGVAVEQTNATRVDSRFPCHTFAIMPGPYLGLNGGLVNVYNNTSSVYRAFTGTAFGGYAFLSSNLYFAAEIFAQHGAQITDYRNNLNNNFNPTGVKTSWSVGLSVLPGLVLSDTILGYLRLGGIETHFYEAAYSAPGAQVGVGIEGAVSESWNVRAEYSFTCYKHVPNLGSPRSDQFRLGVLYKFWS